MVSGVGTKHYFHQNHLYSVAAMTDSVGAVVERCRYDAYGKRTVTNAAGTPISASTIGQQRGFTGYYLDAETGLYYARARMYSPGLGRFVSRDPKGYVDGNGLYFAYFIPNSTDPTGMCTGTEVEGEHESVFDVTYADPEPRKTDNYTRGSCSTIPAAKLQGVWDAAMAKAKILADGLSCSGTCSSGCCEPTWRTRSASIEKKWYFDTGISGYCTVRFKLLASILCKCEG